jgi:ABC-type lipoprotein release transport system permease subunit
MFGLRLALGKLAMQGGRSLGKVVFFATVFAVILSCLLFMAGSDQQMLRSIREIKGDATIDARPARGEQASLDAMASAIVAGQGAALADSQLLWQGGVQLNTDRAVRTVRCIGAGEGYLAHLSKTVVWRGPAPAGLQGGLVLEAGVADALFVKAGDIVTVKWLNSDTGRANSLQLPVTGILIGSGLLFAGQAFTGLSDMRQLVMDDTASNGLRLWYQISDAGAIRERLRDISGRYGDAVSIDSVTVDPTGGLFGVYKYYNLLLIFLLWSLVVIFFVIMNYSNRNVFFIEYRRRRNELATFLTYGLSPAMLRLVVAWEALVLTAASLAAGCLLTLALTGLASQFEINSVEYADLITAIGGTRPAFALSLGPIAGALAATVLIMVGSAISGANHYLRQEISQIIGNPD